MMPLYFTGRPRLAAEHLLGHTAIGDALAGHVDDDGALLTVHGSAQNQYDVMSSGERQLFKLLGAIGGHDCVNLYALVNMVDERTASECFAALRLLFAIEVPV